MLYEMVWPKLDRFQVSCMRRGGVDVPAADRFLGGRTTELAVSLVISPKPPPNGTGLRPPPNGTGLRPPPNGTGLRPPPPRKSLPVAPICRRSIFNQSL